ncbi:hypothetical protein OHU25_42340 [Streptomyces sp. NBC_00117]
MSDRGKVVEILALRHRITVLERQLAKEKVWFSPSDWAFWQRCCTGCRWTCCAGCGC